jgi:hypothetical protein
MNPLSLLPEAALLLLLALGLLLRRHLLRSPLSVQDWTKSPSDNMVGDEGVRILEVA